MAGPAEPEGAAEPEGVAGAAEPEGVFDAVGSGAAAADEPSAVAPLGWDGGTGAELGPQAVKSNNKSSWRIHARVARMRRRWSLSAAWWP